MEPGYERRYACLQNPLCSCSGNSSLGNPPPKITQLEEGPHTLRQVIEPLSYSPLSRQHFSAHLLCAGHWLASTLGGKKSTRPARYLDLEPFPLFLGEQPSNRQCGNYPDTWFPPVSQEGWRTQVFNWLTLPLDVLPLKGKAVVLLGPV